MSLSCAACFSFPLQYCASPFGFVSSFCALLFPRPLASLFSVLSSTCCFVSAKLEIPHRAYCYLYMYVCMHAFTPLTAPSIPVGPSQNCGVALVPSRSLPYPTLISLRLVVPPIPPRALPPRPALFLNAPTLPLPHFTWTPAARAEKTAAPGSPRPRPSPHRPRPRRSGATGAATRGRRGPSRRPRRRS